MPHGDGKPLHPRLGPRLPEHNGAAGKDQLALPLHSPPAGRPLRPEDPRFLQLFYMPGGDGDGKSQLLCQLAHAPASLRQKRKDLQPGL